MAAELARRKAANEPRLIQPLARPIEKKIEMPVVDVNKKPVKVPLSALKNRKPEPVQMVEQTGVLSSPKAESTSTLNPEPAPKPSSKKKQKKN